MTAVERVLTEPERYRLADLEETIGHGLQTFVEVGTALAEVRDSRLYRAEWDTFENYCDARWGLERSSAYRLIEAASVVSAIADTGASVLPSNVAQTRELAAVPEPDRAAVWAKVNEATGGKPTAAAVREAARPPVPDPVAAALDEFPELGALPPAEAVRVAKDLRAIPPGPERERRREAAGTWKKVLDHQATKNLDQIAAAERYTTASEIVEAVIEMGAAILRLGGPEAYNAGAEEADPLSLDTWTSAITRVSSLLHGMTPRRLRSVK